MDCPLTKTKFPKSWNFVCLAARNFGPREPRFHAESLAVYPSPQRGSKDFQGTLVTSKCFPSTLKLHWLDFKKSIQGDPSPSPKSRYVKMLFKDSQISWRSFSQPPDTSAFNIKPWWQQNGCYIPPLSTCPLPKYFARLKKSTEVRATLWIHQQVEMDDWIQPQKETIRIHPQSPNQSRCPINT